MKEQDTNDMTAEQVAEMKERVVNDRLPALEALIDGLLQPVRERRAIENMTREEAILRMGAAINAALDNHLKDGPVASQLAARDLMIAIAIVKLSELSDHGPTETGSAMVEVDE